MVLQGIKPLKAMGIEGSLIPTFEKYALNLSQTYRDIVTARQAVACFQEPAIVILIMIGLVAVMNVADKNIPTILVMMVLFYRAATGIGQAQQSYQTLVMNVPFFWSIRKRVSDANAAAEQLHEGKTPELTQSVRLEKVNFAYDDRPVLVDANIEIPARKLTAIVGKSGAGKTTVTDLICGLIEPQCGQICIDGIPMSQISLKSWRRGIGYVPQEPFLFHDTLLYNVILTDSNASLKDAEWALRCADAWNFVSTLPKGVRTIVGERGIRFSGGQRQRIAIARALVRRPKLLILDEATTALDPNTEQSICSTLQELSKTVTILAISHQPAIVDIADQVYSIENGHIELVKSLVLAGEVDKKTWKKS